jgi:hypothetical protein
MQEKRGGLTAEASCNLQATIPKAKAPVLRSAFLQITSKQRKNPTQPNSKV